MQAEGAADRLRRGSRAMRRRDFIMALGGAVAAWPLAVPAQERVRRIGVLMSTAAEDAESTARLAAFLHALRQLGWTDGHNVQIDTRWTAGDTARLRAYTAELLELAPDVIVAGGRASSIVAEVERAGRSVPILTVQAVDPVGAGYVANRARPGGNVTGFTQLEYGLSAKWLELLKQIAPRVTRVAVLRESGSAGIGQWAVIQAAAPAFAMELSLIDTRDPDTIERG